MHVIDKQLLKAACYSAEYLLITYLPIQILRKSNFSQSEMFHHIIIFYFTGAVDSAFHTSLRDSVTTATNSVAMGDVFLIFR